jgi:DNA-binding beta-propeller fold protein YncE
MVMTSSIRAALAPLSVALCATAFASVVAGAEQTTHYTLVTTIDLPGDKGGHGDWTTFEPDTRTVWLSQSPDHNVVVVDTESNTIKHVIPGIEDGHGIGFSSKYAFISDNAKNVTVVVDKRTFGQVGVLKPAGKGPNGVVVDSKTGNVFVGSDSSDMTVFNGKPPFAQIAAFKLAEKPSKDGPDVGIYVRAKDRLYQPIDNTVAVVDPNHHKVIATWDVGVKGQTKPMVFDRKTARFLLGTTDQKMLSLDAESGRVVKAISVKGKVDETVIDEAARRAFVGDKAGLIEVVDLDQGTVVDSLPSEPNVHTLAVNPVSHAIYVYRNESNKLDVFVPR